MQQVEQLQNLLLMLKDFVDSAGGGRPHLSAIKCVETAVSSGCPK